MLARLDEPALMDLKRKQGLPLTNVDLRIVGPGDENLPFDGVSQGGRSACAGRGSRRGTTA